MRQFIELADQVVEMKGVVAVHVGVLYCFCLRHIDIILSAKLALDERAP